MDTIETLTTPRTLLGIEWVHALSVSVEIELKMDWQECKKLKMFLHLIG